MAFGIWHVGIWHVGSYYSIGGGHGSDGKPSYDLADAWFMAKPPTKEEQVDAGGL